MKLSIKDLKNIVKIAKDSGISKLKSDGLELEFFDNSQKSIEMSTKQAVTEGLTELLNAPMKDSDGSPLTEDDLVFYSSDANQPNELEKN